MKHTHRRVQRRQPEQFTRDDCARFIAEAINAVLEKLSIRQIVEGIAVLPLGEGVWMADIVMRGLVTQKTWGISVTIPLQEETDERE